MDDVFGTALLDYCNGNYTEDLITHSIFGEDTMPLPYLFRDFKTMPKIEQLALQHCRSKVLDIGCGAGPHSLYLQKIGINVTALDQSEKALEVCRLRGISKTVHSNILDYNGNTFDTLLLLMNGIGIVGKLKNLGTYLAHLKTLLNPNGKILLDSTDIIYMYKQDIDGGYWVNTHEDYYGETSFTMIYKNVKSRVFDWLYVDYNTLASVANENGFQCELVSMGEHYDYLAKLLILPY